MDYDVVILGGGLTGCSIAYELSKYNLNIALIEKNTPILGVIFSKVYIAIYKTINIPVFKIKICFY